MRAKKYLLLFLSAVLILNNSCKKAIDNIKEDLIVNLITDNTWKVVRYLDGNNNLTTQFADYDFKFTKDDKVNAVLNGVVVASGTWVGSEAGQSITAEFPDSAEPFSKLTGVWIVTNTKSKPWRVYSHRFENTKELMLDLEAK